MDEIRSWWQVPCIAHFCSLFRTAFALTDFEIEDLEDALMISGGQEESRFLADLHARLLRGLFSKKADINADNFEPYLSEVLKVRWVDDSKLNRKNPLETASYKDLSIWEKVDILHSLCDWRLDCDDVPDHLKGMEASSLRVEPLGQDRDSNTYWYFYGTRLYKECIERTEKRTKVNKQRVKKKRKKKFKKKKKIKKQWSSGSESTTTSESESSTEQDEYEVDDETGDDDSEYKGMSSGDGAETKRTWSLVCSTKEEWEALAEAFANSHNKDEKNMYETLTVDFLAEISRMLEAKDKAFRKKLLVEMAPRRSSDRIAIKAQQKEEEDKLAEIERQQEKERLAEIKKQEAEAKEKERQILSEKRQRERAERARLREERQWLIMSGGEVSEEILQSLEKNGEIRDEDENDEKKLDELDKAFEGDVDMFTGMYKVLDVLRNHEDGWPFLEPVEESYAPHYFEIITNPMDLSTIEKKIDAKEYKGLKEFISDMKLMFKNCLEYNGETSCYTQMARTLENVFERQMKKHFPDDDNQSSDEDFEEELTESELRKLNKKKMSDANGMEDLVKAADIHRSNQKQTLDPRFKDPAMFARHFGMNPMANNVTRMMQDPMGFQRMPYMRQPFYPPQMYPGHPAFARFNMNDFPRGAAPMFSPMMGLGHPAMRMNPQTAGQFSNPDVSSGMVRGVAPVATKGEASSSMWTNNLIQDNRGMGRPYPPHRLTSPNTPWQTPAGVLPDGRQMLAGWRPPNAMSNGVTSVNQGTSLERTHESTEQKQRVSNDDRPQELLNDRKESGDTLQPDKNSSKNEDGGSDHAVSGPIKVTGNQPSEEDLRFPFIMGQSRPSNEPKTATYPSIPANSSTVSKLPNPNRVEGVESPVGVEGQRVRTPPVTLESDEGKVFINLSSKVNQPRVGDKRSNPHSVSSLMSNEEQQSKRSAHEQLKFSTLLQEMSQGRRPEHLLHPRTSDAQFMDLHNTRNHIPPSLIRKQQAERGVGGGSPSEPQAHPPAYPKPVDGIQPPLNRGVPASFMDMRSPGDMLAPERTGFNARTMYPGYSSHGEFQRQQMMLLQQQQMMQRHHMAGSMMANGMPRNMPPEYAYLAQRPMFGAMMGQYKNGTRAPDINDLTGKKPRVS